MSSGNTGLVMLMAALVAGAPGPVLGQEFARLLINRLFTTPAERERIDIARQRVRANAPGPGESSVSEAQSSPVRLQGLVVRSLGPDTVWINDSSTLGGNEAGGVRVHSSDAGGTVVISLPGRGPVTLQPGQVYDPRSLRVEDIVVRRHRSR